MQAIYVYACIYQLLHINACICIIYIYYKIIIYAMYIHGMQMKNLYSYMVYK